ncbi:hypothetical protein KFL_003810080 [Klebsormidium nitens]|uniref:Apple domain-containing protein n=1 Tax=Klebsormidium nitens TaxID=105231 RepID=A0A1Y1IA49_KLENI|nr:hypothetical protein KFL_003810080 [Klebsormidium nitens]|eukprot:GAQ87844.1 hypothetical protein KFL_003810080 [Klebsormidium nitens]
MESRIGTHARLASTSVKMLRQVAVTYSLLCLTSSVDAFFNGSTGVTRGTKPSTLPGQCELFPAQDFLGHDINNGCRNPQPSAAACCSSCDSTAGCVAWTWHGSVNPGACNVWGECWLKDSVTVLVPSTDSQAVAGRSSAVPSTQGTCDHFPAQDFVGHDINNGCENLQPSASACCASCYTNDHCVAWSWHGSINPSACNVFGECWLKDMVASLSSSSDPQAVAGKLKNVVIPTTPIGSYCAAQTHLGFDFYGVDLNNGAQNPQPTADACCNSCESDPYCVGWTWHGARNPQGSNVFGECWLKSSLPDYPQRSNDPTVVTGRMLRSICDGITPNKCYDADNVGFTCCPGRCSAQTSPVALCDYGDEKPSNDSLIEVEFITTIEGYAFSELTQKMIDAYITAFSSQGDVMEVAVIDITEGSFRFRTRIRIFSRGVGAVFRGAKKLIEGTFRAGINIIFSVFQVLNPGIAPSRLVALLHTVMDKISQRLSTLPIAQHQQAHASALVPRSKKG